MTEKEYEALNDMFASEGWSLFNDAAQKLLDVLINAAPDHADTNDKWQYARGQIQQIKSIVSYPTFIKATWEQELEDKRIEATDNQDAIDVNTI